MAEVGYGSQQGGKDKGHIKHMMDVGPLVSYEGNYRNVQVERLSKGLTLRTLLRRSN